MLIDQFEEHRAHVRTVAYRMLGSASDAEDAVQETWIRFSRADVGGVENLRAWLTTVVARVCLDMLRARTSRRRGSADVYCRSNHSRLDLNPESEAVQADRWASPPHRARPARPGRAARFVLHDVSMRLRGSSADRRPHSVAARQLASRRGRRVQSKAPSSVVIATAAARRRCVPGCRPREGTFEDLVAVSA